MPKVKRPDFLEKRYKRQGKLRAYFIDREMKRKDFAERIRVSEPTASRRVANPEDLTIGELYLMKLSMKELYDLVNGI